MPAKAAPDCGQCGNQARSDARFCDRCGAELSNGGGAPDTVVDLDSAPDAATRLQFAKRLPEVDMNIPFGRLREGKRTAKALAAFFKGRAALEVKFANDLRKQAATSLVINEPESKGLTDLIGRMTAAIELDVQFCTMYSQTITDDVLVALEQVRHLVKEQVATCTKQYTDARNTLRSAESNLAKVTEKLAKLEHQSEHETNSANAFLAARSAAKADSAKQAIPGVRKEQAQAQEAVVSSQQYLKAAQASVLDQLEDIEVQRMHRTLECLDKAMTLGVGLQRQKLAFEWDLARRLRSVSGPHDIESWVATVSKHARSPATNVDHQQEPKVEVDTCAMPAQDGGMEKAADSPATTSKPAVDVPKVTTVAPMEVDSDQPESAWAVPVESRVAWLPGDLPKQMAVSCPMLAINRDQASIMALCALDQLCQTPDLQKYCRSDLRILLGVREDHLLAAIDQYGQLFTSEYTSQTLLGYARDDFQAFLRGIFIVLGIHLTEDRCTADFRCSTAMIVSAAKSNVVDSDSIDVFLQSLDVPLGHLELPFQAQFAVFLYRRLLSAIVDKPNGDDDDDDDLDGNASSRAFDDWSTVLERIAQFKTANNVSDAVHAALLLEVIHTEILLDIQNEMYPEEYPKVDLMSKVNDCTAAAIDHAVDCITASFDAAVPLAAAIKQQFRDWLCVLLDSNVLVDVRSYRRVATLLARLDGGTETLRQCVARSARRAYADIRDRVASRTNAILDWNEFAPSLASEVTMLSTTQDPGIDTIRGIYRDVFRQALARDALWSAQASPSDWMEILSSMTVVDLDVKDVVESIGAVRLAGWVQQQREQVAGLVERMLLADRWTVADEKSGTSSSVVDVFSAMYGAMEALMATARKVGLDMPGRGGGSGSPAASEIVDLMNDYVDVYASSVVEAARPSPTALASKTGVVGRQTNSAHLIQVADHDHNKVRTRFGNMTKSLKSKLHAHTHSIDMSSSSSSPTSATSPPCETVAMPVAASSKSVDELAVRLCNCREALLRLTSLEYDLSERFSVDGSSMQRGREALGRQIAALQALIGERIVYHDLQATFDRLYNPAVSSATGFAAVMANQLDAIMSAAYAAVRDQHFPGEPSFPAIVHKVFAALMEALTWVTGHGAGGRCFADTDFMTFTEDIAAIQAMFGSELSEATAGALAKPFEERVQDLAQSSNEIAQRYSAGTCSKDDATIVLHRRTDPIAVAWVHAENKSR